MPCGIFHKYDSQSSSGQKYLQEEEAAVEKNVTSGSSRFFTWGHYIFLWQYVSASRAGMVILHVDDFIEHQRWLGCDLFQLNGSISSRALIYFIDCR